MNHPKEQMERGGDEGSGPGLTLRTRLSPHRRAPLPAQPGETSSNNRSRINISFFINKSIKEALFGCSSSESLRSPVML